MADAVSDGAGQVVIHLPRPQQEREPAAAPQLLEHACGEGGVRDKGDRRGSQARKRGKHQRTDENHLELDVQSPSRNDERHDRRAGRDHSRDDHASQRRIKNHTCQSPFSSHPRRAAGEGGAFPTAASPSHMQAADLPTLPGVYRWATKKRHMWGTRCSGGKSAGSEHLRAPYHRPSMWEGLYPLPTIRDGNTFDKIATLLTEAETVQERLA